MLQGQMPGQGCVSALAWLARSLFAFADDLHVAFYAGYGEMRKSIRLRHPNRTTVIEALSTVNPSASDTA